MRSVQMKRAAADDLIAFFQNQKVADVFANLGQGARQQCAVRGIRGDQIMDSLRVRQKGFTRAQRWLLKKYDRLFTLKPTPKFGPHQPSKVQSKYIGRQQPLFFGTDDGR